MLTHPKANKFWLPPLLLSENGNTATTNANTITTFPLGNFFSCIVGTQHKTTTSESFILLFGGKSNKYENKL